MALTPFLDDNRERAYPFVEPTDDAPAEYPYEEVIRKGIVDFGAILSPAAEYDPRLHTVWLSAVRRRDEQFEFEFSSDCPGAYGVLFTFTRPVATEDYVVDWREYGDTGGSSAGCSGFPLARGFLHTAHLGRLAALLPADGELDVTATQYGTIEPGRVQSLRRGLLTSINIANFDRTHVDPAEGCGSASAGERPLYIDSQCLAGDIKLVEGYNTNIRQVAADNALIIGGAVNGGAGQPCDEIPLYPGETAPDGSQLLSGGPACTEVLKSINGVAGPAIQLLTGPGFSVDTAPGNPSRLVITFSPAAFAACDPSPDAASSSSAAL